MTNEEILKRFQFDLDLGLFKSNFNILCIIDIVDENHYKQFDHSISDKTLKLMMALKKLGYEDHSTPRNFMNIAEIIINTNKKNFRLSNSYTTYSAGRKLVHNSYPEYLLDYQYQER